MTDCHNIHALFHEPFNHKFLYLTQNETLISTRSAAIWLYRVVLHARCSTVSSASAHTCQNGLYFSYRDWIKFSRHQKIIQIDFLGHKRKYSFPIRVKARLKHEDVWRTVCTCCRLRFATAEIVSMLADSVYIFEAKRWAS